MKSSVGFDYREKVKKIKKNRIIKKAKIKKDYFKKIKKNEKLETPEFYKEIFGQQSSSINDSNDQEIHDNEIITAQELSSRPKLQQHKDDNDSLSSSFESVDSDDDVEKKGSIAKGKKKKDDTKTNKRNSSKPNPFEKRYKETERLRLEKQARIEASKKEREEQAKRRVDYYMNRKQTKKKLFKRTAKGQPVMKSQIEHLLSKIKSSVKQ
ncbi:9301_t:CDS:2 [Ambispora leptoticha]|uniref:rRNA-processing protein FYV7 n=1 Tax=Ambispora leptoticha TaxID=144679 RepID=A0A9N9G001_9GLOM|nr:9301_t:CDS:2 [Ambispora leptoticha]